MPDLTNAVGRRVRLVNGDVGRVGSDEIGLLILMPSGERWYPTTTNGSHLLTGSSSFDVAEILSSTIDLTNAEDHHVLLRNGEIGFVDLVQPNGQQSYVNIRTETENITTSIDGLYWGEQSAHAWDVIDILNDFFCDLRRVRLGDNVLLANGNEVSVSAIELLTGAIRLGNGEAVTCFGRSHTSRPSQNVVRVMTRTGPTKTAIESNNKSQKSPRLKPKIGADDLVPILNRCMQYAPYLPPETFLAEIGADQLFKIHEGTIVIK